MAVSAAPAVAVTTSVVASAPARELMPVVAPRFDAAYLDNPKPSYPPLARRFREQGVVMIDVRVTAAGFVETAKIRESSGSSRLDEAALAAVARWRFVPARQGGTAVAAWVVVPIRFALDSD